MNDPMKICLKSVLGALFVFFPLLNASAQEARDRSPDADPVLYVQDDFYRNVINPEVGSGLNKWDKSGSNPALGSGSIKVVNFGNAFRVFLAKAENADQETQLAAWKELEANIPPRLVKAIFRANPEGLETARKKALLHFMAAMPRVRGKMLRLFDAGPAVIKTAFARFKEAFPDYSDDITVYIVPSMFRFNACAMPGLIAFGPDVMASMGESEESFAMATTHEVFHTYSFSKIPAYPNTFAGPLWLEGSATYVSGFLNPEATEADMLLDPVLAGRCADPDFVKDLAAQYRPILARFRKGADAEAIYAAWYMYYKSTPENPSRRGYCLGLQVFKKLAAAHDISLMMTWPEPELSKALDETLAEIAAN